MGFESPQSEEQPTTEKPAKKGKKLGLLGALVVGAAGLAGVELSDRMDEDSAAKWHADMIHNYGDTFEKITLNPDHSHTVMFQGKEFNLTERAVEKMNGEEFNLISVNRIEGDETFLTNWLETHSEKAKGN